MVDNVGADKTIWTFNRSRLASYRNVETVAACMQRLLCLRCANQSIEPSYNNKVMTGYIQPIN
jgi:hypothetical protein